MSQANECPASVIPECELWGLMQYVFAPAHYRRKPGEKRENDYVNAQSDYRASEKFLHFDPGEQKSKVNLRFR